MQGSKFAGYKGSTMHIASNIENPGDQEKKELSGFDSHANSNLNQRLSALADDLKFRRLVYPRHGGLSVWAFIFGVVISGETFGWNVALQHGWMNLLIATVYTSVLYISIAEFTSSCAKRLPFSCGVLSIADIAFGPQISTFLVLLMATTMSFLLALNIITLAGYVQYIIASDATYNLFICFLLIMLVYLINRKLSVVLIFLHFLSFYSVFALFIMLFLNFGAIVYMGNATYENSWQDPKPITLSGFANCVPAAIWWYLGAEMCGDVCEEIDEFPSIVRPSLRWAVFSLQAFVVVILLYGPVFGTYDVIETSSNPLLDTISYQFGILHASATYKLLLLALMAPIALVSAVGGMFSTARQFYALARRARIPRQLSLTINGSPLFALMYSCVYAFIVLTILSACSFLQLSDDPSFMTEVLMMVPAGTASLSFILYSSACIIFEVKRWKAKAPGASEDRTRIIISSAFACTLSAILLLLLLITNPQFYGPLLAICFAMYLLVIIYLRLHPPSKEIEAPSLVYLDTVDFIATLEKKAAEEAEEKMQNRRPS